MTYPRHLVLGGLMLALGSLRRFARQGSPSRHNETRQKQSQGLPNQTLANVTYLARHPDLSWATFRTSLSDPTCTIAASENYRRAQKSLFSKAELEQLGKYDPQDGDPDDSEVCDDG